MGKSIVQRINTLDILKGISIIMIIDVHLPFGPIFRIGQTFNVCIFFIIVGILYRTNALINKFSILEIVKKRINSLLYPYIALSLLNIVMTLVIKLLFKPAWNVTELIVKTISLQGVGTLWFLPVLFFAEIIFYTLRVKFNESILLIIAGFGVFCLFISPHLASIGLIGLNVYGKNTIFNLFCYGL